MDAFGLPTSFGKSQAEEPTAGPSSSSSSSRGGPSGRGDRGVVGGGKRNKRGRGRGGEVNVGQREGETTMTGMATATTTTTPSGWDRDRGSANLASQYDAFNGGVKRPHNSDQARQDNLHGQPMNQFPSSESRGRGGGGHRGRGRGGQSDRGGGGGRGGFSGSGGGRKQDTFHGRFLKSSMWEDPWIGILQSRQAGKT